ncbi:hypothetical protein [Shimia sp.]|uniref:hypothetical protein n=1 Tax=Shimia sp. TaxID=1954381 RepID=UPI003296C2B6
MKSRIACFLEPNRRNVDHFFYIPDAHSAESCPARTHNVLWINQDTHAQQHKRKELIPEICGLPGLWDKSPFDAKIPNKVGERKPRRVTDQKSLITQLHQINRVARGQRMMIGQNDGQPFARNRLAVENWRHLPHEMPDERDIDLPIQNQFNLARAWIEPDTDLDPWLLPPEELYGFRQLTENGKIGVGDGEASALSFGYIPGIACDLIDKVKKFTKAFVKRFTGFGHFYCLGGSIQKRKTKFGFQRLNGLGQGWLRRIQNLCRFPEAAAFDDGFEHQKLAQGEIQGDSSKLSLDDALILFKAIRPCNDLAVSGSP